jgi:putative DNA primase/helicase
MQVPYAYNEAATCPRFDRFLEEITNSDADQAAFLHRALGYSLTGLSEAQCMFICYGDGANGKSTLLDLFNELLGDYAKSTPVQTFVARKADGGASDDLARLRGARYVVTAESEANQPLAEALIKRVTGGDIVTARHLYGNHFDFKPQFKVWLSTNNRLRVSGADKGIWRRLKEIPFLASFPNGDPKLPDILRGEAEGVLAWAVRGYLAFQKEGLSPPQSVLQSTESYRQEMDLVGQFTAERMIRGRGERLSKDDAYQAYLRWAEENGTERLSKQEFGKRLERMGIRGRKSGSSRFWDDISLIVSDEPMPEIQVSPKAAFAHLETAPW